MPRIFLALVAAVYLFLGFWCLSNPDETAQAIGFELQGGSGQSEYFTVYGGLQIALGLLFLLPWFKSEYTHYCLTSCLIIHLTLVVFRSSSLFRFDVVHSTTFVIATGEWVLLLSTLAVWWKTNTVVADHHSSQ